MVTQRISIEDAEGRAFVEFHVATGNTIEITNIIVDDRRKGMGRRLVELVKERYYMPSTLYAFTRLSNQIAGAFWDGIGFRQVAIIPRFYRDGKMPESAVMFCLEIGR